MTHENPKILSLDELVEVYVEHAGYITTTKAIVSDGATCLGYEEPKHNTEPDESDVELLMSQLPDISADLAKKTLCETKNDIVEALIRLTNT